MQAVWIALGGNALFLVVVAFLGRKLITHWLNKDFERFKQKIESSAAIELERVKGGLTVIAAEHSILLSRLQDRRAEVIGTLYAKIMTAKRLTELGVHPMQAAALGDNPGDKMPPAAEAIREARNTFDQTQIWLTESCARSVEDLMSKIVTLYNEHIRHHALSHLSGNASLAHGPSESLVQAWEALTTNELPRALKALETEMRSLLEPPRRNPQTAPSGAAATPGL